jgi:hypothetical protein
MVVEFQELDRAESELPGVVKVVKPSRKPRKNTKSYGGGTKGGRSVRGSGSSRSARCFGGDWGTKSYEKIATEQEAIEWGRVEARLGWGCEGLKDAIEPEFWGVARAAWQEESNKRRK